MRVALFAVLVSVVSCSPESHPSALTKALPIGIAASVGNDDISLGTVLAIANAHGIERTEARSLAIKDALFAAAVRSDPGRAAGVAVAERGILGRVLLENFEEQSRGAGPPSDAEVNEVTAERWTELDRPPSVRTTHAVVLVKNPSEAAKGRALVEELAETLRSTRTSAEFIARAQAFPVAPLELRAERLSPVTSDGRMWEFGARPGTPATNVDLDYARAATALAEPGDQSPVTKTAFGYHVILLEERIPEARPSLEERRAALGDEIVARRAKKLLDAALSRLRQATPIEVERTADSLTALVTAGQ